MRLIRPALLAAAIFIAAPILSLSAQRGRGGATPPARPDSSQGAAQRGGGDQPDSTGGGGGGGGGARGGGGPYAALRFRQIGPASTSGRVADIAVDPRNKHIWFIATASGGVWKTTNSGTTWTPVFDNEASYSTGTVVIDPRSSSTIWVGTGEGNAQRSVSFGDGVYKSTDGGRTWQNMGLRESEHIGKIVIDPRNSDVVYVAAQGPLSRKGGDRGLYKTIDGGKTWKKILESGTWAGAADVVLDPRNPDVLVASMWQRERTNFGYIAGGPESGLYRSTDAGVTWRKIPGALAGDALGRIGLAISPKNPDVVYAIAEAGGTAPAGGGGFFRSRDGGANWDRMGTHTSIGLYYTKLIADPTDVDRVYSVDVQTQVSDDGGRTFRAIGERGKHVDNHAVWVDPDDADHLVIGCDGGLYETFDRGSTYKFFPNLPLGQFYRIDADNATPFYHVYGGLQDNGSVGGPSRTRNQSGITSADWVTTAGGDGFHSRVDPKDPAIVYAESQHGALERRNLKTGEVMSIVPEAEPNEGALRWYWDSPLVISPFSNTRLYFASQRLFRSEDRGNTWKAISPDLSRQIDRNRLKLMDRVWPIDAVAKNTSSSFYGEIVAVAESPMKENQLWIGTDDGRIAVSEDGGANWRKIDTFAGVPDTTYVSRITPSSHDANTVFAAFDNHMSGDYKPYLLKSTDLGKSWTSIAGNLPERGTVYSVIDDPKDPNMLFAGTEFGLYVTRDGGRRWTRLRNGLPTIMVRDLEVQKRDDQLIVGTFGRGIWILDDLATLRGLTPEVIAQNTLLPVARTPLFVQMPARPDASRGSDFFAMPNPQVGASIYYYLKDAARTMRDRRQAAERAASRRGEDVYYPAWDSLKAEDREEPVEVVLTIKDAQGQTIRTLGGPAAQGLNHVVWNLRYAAFTPVTEGGAAAGRGGRGGGGGGGAGGEGADSTGGGGGRGAGGPPSGALVAPGMYQVSIARRANGLDTPIGQAQRFEVYQLDSTATPRTQAIVAFHEQSAKLQRAVLGANAGVTEMLSRSQALRRAIDETPSADPKLAGEARKLSEHIRDIQDMLVGDNTIARHQEPSPPSLLSRLNSVTGQLWSSTLEAPTATQRRQYAIVAAAFPSILEQVKAADGDLRQLEDQAEAAGVPWTPGRVPVWKP